MGFLQRFVIRCTLFAIPLVLVAETSQAQKKQVCVLGAESRIALHRQQYVWIGFGVVLCRCQTHCELRFGDSQRPGREGKLNLLRKGGYDGGLEERHEA